MNKINQRQKVLNWLQHRGGLTVRQAMLELNINSLPKRIEELKKEGYMIRTEMVRTESGSRYGVYRLEELA